MHKATVAALVDLLAVHAGAAVVEVGFGEGIGPVKPVNGVGQPPMIGQLADWSMMHYLKEAGIPYSRLRDGGRWCVQLVKADGTDVPAPLQVDMKRHHCCVDNMPSAYRVRHGYHRYAKQSSAELIAEGAIS